LSAGDSRSSGIITHRLILKRPGNPQGNQLIPIHDNNPTVIRPWVTIALIVVNVLIFIWQYTLPPQLLEDSVYQLGVIPAVLLGRDTLSPELAIVPAWTTMVSSMFLHGGLLHLGGNMLYLWIFGNNVEDSMGHLKFLLFYLLSGFAATALQIALEPGSTIPVIGASGAISGVLGAYLLLYPHAVIKMLVPIFIIIRVFSIRAVWVLCMYFLLQIGGLLSAGFNTSESGGGIAYGAHLGGFIAGVLLIAFFRSAEFRLHNPLQAFSKANIPDQPRARPPVPAPASENAATPAPDTVTELDPAGDVSRDQNQIGADRPPTPEARNTDQADLADPDDLDDYARDRNRLSDLE